jgi:hypothetical protein
MKSACRRVTSDLKTNEIVSLYKLIREEAMSRRYHGQQYKDALYSPDAQPEKQFRVDRALWMSLFKELGEDYNLIYRDHKKYLKLKTFILLISRNIKWVDFRKSSKKANKI